MSASELDFIHRYAEGATPTTLLLLHGTGGDENDLVPLGRAVAPEAGLLSPRGQVLENGMPRFFRRLSMGVFDVEDLKSRTEDLARFIEAAGRHYGFALSDVVALGYSNGANFAASLLFLRPTILRRAALLHAMVPFEPDHSLDLSGASVLLTGGSRDPMVPMDETERLGRLLSEAGAHLSFQLQPGGHELTPDEVEAVRVWLLQTE
ncbi:alpha/beta hydrolase [soil metagenome]